MTLHQPSTPALIRAEIFSYVHSAQKPILIYEYVVADVSHVKDTMVRRDLQGGIDMLKSLVLDPVPEELWVFQRLAKCVSGEPG
jgi:hypothetical protein